MCLSDWADEFAFLSAESSAHEGPWRTLPYQKPIMDAMTDPENEIIVVKKSARIGYTKMINNLIGYHIHQDPCSIMVVQPTLDDAEGYSKEEIAPMIRDTKVLTPLVSEMKSKDSNNTILSKSFPGGIIAMVGANSPRGFRRVSRRVVLFDEIDGYPESAGEEGDQISLGMRRSEYYWNRKIILGSTPTIKNHSRIESWYDRTDMRMYFVPCPECGHMQTLKWANFKWPEGRPQDVRYVCESCEFQIENSQKYDMISKGEFRPTKESEKPGLVGFFIWAAYSSSPNATWANIAREFLDSKSDKLKLKTFVNTVLGETFEERGERIDHSGLMNRCENWETGAMPDGAHVITCGIDVQRNRIEVEFVGWGRKEESWSLSYDIIPGDPTGDEIWGLLDAVVMRTFKHKSGVLLNAFRIFIDSGNGEHMDRIYAWARSRVSMGVFACKGSSDPKAPICSEKSYQKKAGIDLYLVGTNACKDLIYGRLTSEPGTPGSMHFPVGRPQEWFEQLTSEEGQYKKGLKVYVKIRNRNEALDCRVYALAALRSIGVGIDDIVNSFETPAQQKKARIVQET